MAQVQIPPPRLPEPPVEYTQQYLADLIRALEIFILKNGLLESYGQPKLPLQTYLPVLQV